MTDHDSARSETSDGGQRRGFFRRARRSDDPVAEVDELARQVDELADEDTADEVDAARLDLTAAARERGTTSPAAVVEHLAAETPPAPAPTPAPAPAQQHAPADPAPAPATAVTPPAQPATATTAPPQPGPAPAAPATSHTEGAPVHDQQQPDQAPASALESRVDAALQGGTVDPAAVRAAIREAAPAHEAQRPQAEAAHAEAMQPTSRQAAPDAGPVPTARRQQPAAMRDAELAHPSSSGSSWDAMQPDVPAAASLGIDVERMVRAIEQESATVRERMDAALRSAKLEANDVLDSAEAEAERIREHGQQQARVLLGEVEEIISEAQATGEQILERADSEASQLRREATVVMQQAKDEARQLVEAARREGEQVLSEQRRLATVRAQEALREQDRLKDQIRRLEERRRQVLESLEPLIAQLTQIIPADHQRSSSMQDARVVQLDRQRSGAGTMG